MRAPKPAEPAATQEARAADDTSTSTVKVEPEETEAEAKPETGKASETIKVAAPGKPASGDGTVLTKDMAKNATATLKIRPRAGAKPPAQPSAGGTPTVKVRPGLAEAKPPTPAAEGEAAAESKAAETQAAAAAPTDRTGKLSLKLRRPKGATAEEPEVTIPGVPAPPEGEAGPGPDSSAAETVAVTPPPEGEAAETVAVVPEEAPEAGAAKKTLKLKAGAKPASAPSAVKAHAPKPAKHAAAEMPAQIGAVAFLASAAAVAALGVVTFFVVRQFMEYCM